MSFQDKLIELAHRLFLGTSQGGIQWAETANEDSFRAVLHKGLVRIERAPTRQPAMVDESTSLISGQRMNRREDTPDVRQFRDPFDYSLIVLDERNKELGRYLPDRPEQMLTLRNLWELANRSARNSEEKLDSLLLEVESKLKSA